jgi:magnesium-transporting ATPase (P-type)
MFYNFTRLPNIVQMIKLAILYFSNASHFDIVSPTFYLILILSSVILNFLFYFYFYWQVRGAEQQWNKGRMLKLRRKKWIEADVTNLAVGDFIKVHKNIICPADILVIDSSDSRLSGKVVLVNEGKLTGLNKMSRKRAIREFKDLEVADTDLQKMFNGNVEYPEPSSKEANSTENLGFFKIKGDPKVIPIRYSNMVYAGSKIISES